MFTNYLFWLAIALLSWSGFCIEASVNNFNGTKQIPKIIVQWIGMAGILAGIVRSIMLCIHFDWWWVIGIVIASFIVMAALSLFIRNFAAIIVSYIGIIGIPIVWWFGGLF
ncbi:MAG: hypothetical protein LBV11_17430 [Bacillus cereus]|jgi:hypothetical protein|nr:hypothetical protein [Bacillus cereus]